MKCDSFVKTMKQFGAIIYPVCLNSMGLCGDNNHMAIATVPWQ